MANVWPSIRMGAVLTALCGVLFFVGLSTGDLFRNEGLRALVAAQTLRTGNWLVPTLHGEPQLTKPPGMAVAIAAVSWPFGGVTTASARLPSALAGCLTVGLIYLTFARILGQRAGLIAAVLLPVSVAWLDRVPSAEIDLLPLAYVTAAMLFLLWAVEAEEENRPFQTRYLFWQLALLAVAAGVLTKWTAPAFFYLTAGVFLVWRGRIGVLFRGPHLLAATVGALPCVGWLVLASYSAGWEVVFDTVSREALQRLSPGHHPRPYPWGELVTFPTEFLAATLPGSAAAILTLSPQFKDKWSPDARRLLQLLHAWAWPSLLFWTLVPGHRPRHALPIQPAIAGLAAFVWIAWDTGLMRWPLARRASESGLVPLSPRGRGVRGEGEGETPLSMHSPSCVPPSPLTPNPSSPRGEGRKTKTPRSRIELTPAFTLAALVLLWMLVKLGFTFGYVPGREMGRDARTTGEELARMVPDGDLIYLCRLKDEGILFYANHLTRRLSTLQDVPEGGVAVMTREEWSGGERLFESIGHLHDEQHAPLVVGMRRRAAQLTRQESSDRP
jgi:Dolichyl-phosphate-mannose-protein mannosyltransferase